MDRWKSRGGKNQRREEKKKEDQKEDAGARKGRKVAKHCVFPMICGSGGRKVGSLKRRVRSHLGRWEMKNCTPLWREAHLEVKMYKAHQVRSTFGSWDIEKVYAIVARSTFPSQNVQHTSASEHFWKMRCSKSARRCGAKHISKSKCKKHHMFRPLLDVQMSFRLAGVRDVRGADFLRGAAFWSIRSSGLLRWFCVTGAALRMTWHDFFVAGAVV